MPEVSFADILRAGFSFCTEIDKTRCACGCNATDHQSANAWAQAVVAPRMHGIAAVTSATCGRAARESTTSPMARKPLERSLGLVTKGAVCGEQKNKTSLLERCIGRPATKRRKPNGLTTKSQQRD